MANKNNIVVPVKYTGKVSCSFIDIDFGQNLSRQEIKKSTSQSESPNGKNSTHLIPPVSPEVCANFYEQNPYHFRAIMLKALCVAGLGFNIIPVDSTLDNYFENEEYKKLKAFIDNPNTEGEVFEEIMINWLCERFAYGQGYLEIVPNKKNELAELYNLRAYNCFPKLSYKNLYYIQKNTDGEVWFKPLGSDANTPKLSKQTELNEVLVIKNYNLKSKYFGFPEWYPATGDLVLDRSVVECRIREFDNNLMIQFMIICEGGELNSDALLTIKKFLTSNYKGASNAGKVLYINSDHPDVKIRIERMDKETRESNFLKTREQSRDYILVSHGVAAILLGAQTSGKLGGSTELKDLFNILNETIIKPEVKVFKSKLKRLFALKLGITNFYLEPKELTVDNLKDMVDYVSKMKESDIIDKNEARQEFGYDPVEEAPADTLRKINDIATEVRNIRKKLVA
jgi:HK97 family phage portal protein